MKNKMIFGYAAAISLTAFALIGCKSSGSTAAATSASGSGSGGSGGSSTQMLASWTIGSDAWSFNFSNGNLTGSSFAAIVTYADTSTCDCTVTLDGTNSAGTYIAAGCYNPLGTTGMAGSNCGDFDSGGTGSYTNNGVNLSLIPFGGGGGTPYHQ